MKVMGWFSLLELEAKRPAGRRRKGARVVVARRRRRRGSSVLSTNSSSSSYALVSPNSTMYSSAIIIETTNDRRPPLPALAPRSGDSSDRYTHDKADPMKSMSITIISPTRARRFQCCLHLRNIIYRLSLFLPQLTNFYVTEHSEPPFTFRLSTIIEKDKIK